MGVGKAFNGKTVLSEINPHRVNKAVRGDAWPRRMFKNKDEKMR